MIFEDRVSAYPNRYLMTDENGNTSYVVLERADEPTAVGTPLSAETFNGMLAGLAPALESEDYPGCYYRVVDGETEWLNPPMIAGVEYRTTERFGGKVVYCKHVSHTSTESYGSYGDVPVDVSVPHGVSGFDSIVKVDARHQGVHLLPIITSGGGTAVVANVGVSNITLRFYKCSFDARTWKFNLYYTKG